MYSVCVVLVFGVALIYGQNLIPPTQAPMVPGIPPTQGSRQPVFDPKCSDRIDSCSAFPDTSCQDPFLEWAKLNCRMRCGFCVGPTTAPPPCVDKIKTCEDYTLAVCTKKEYKSWVQENCRAFCNAFYCTDQQRAHLTTTTTTISSIDCYDRVDCRTYDSAMCTSKEYSGWAKDNCPLYCGLCQGTPTTPPICEDRIPNCKAYSPSICSDKDYTVWVQDNCRKFCSAC